MQDAGHAAVVVYRKCPATQQIRSNNAPAGFMAFSFEPCMFWWDETVKVTIALSKVSVDFFKKEALKYNTQYQKMILRLLDEYATHQA